MDNLQNRLTSDLGKKSEIFHYSQKEDPKISTIAKFGMAKCFKIRKTWSCEVCKFCIYLYYADKRVPFSQQFQLKNVNFFRAKYKYIVIYKIWKLRRAIYIFRILQNFATKLCHYILILKSSF